MTAIRRLRLSSRRTCSGRARRPGTSRTGGAAAGELIARWMRHGGRPPRAGIDVVGVDLELHTAVVNPLANFFRNGADHARLMASAEGEGRRDRDERTASVS